mgnify:CR=1 FL=1
MRLSDHEVEVITDTYRKTGDVAARDKLILSHMPLALSYMKRSGFNGFTKYEFLSELFYALVDGVTKAQTKLYDNNITPYLKSCLRNQAIKYRSRLPLIRVPRDAYALGFRPPKIKTLRPEHCRTPTDRNDLLEFVFSHAKEITETQILLGLIEGKNYEEIGDELGLTRSRISQIAAGVRERMQRKLRVLEDTNGNDRDNRVHEKSAAR